MRLLHLADLHLGKVVHGYSMIEEQRYILRQILAAAEEQKVDAVLIAGDVYDRAVASEEAVRLFDEFLVRLAALSLEVFVISGNHDSGERLNYGRRFFQKQRIHIAGTYEASLGRVTLTDEHGAVNFYLLPFVTKATLRHAWPEEEITSYDEAIATALKHAEVDFTARNVILAHQFVAHGDSRPTLGGSEIIAPSVGTIEAIGSQVFDGFDYAALGHVHRPQWIGRETVRYAGSPLKYSLREANDEKTMALVTLEAKGDAEVKTLSLRPRRDLRRVEGKLADLRAAAEATDDYLYVTLTDELPVLNAMELVRQFYPNTMKVDFAPGGVRERKAAATQRAPEEKDFASLVREFYAREGGAAPTQEEWAVLNEAAREAGVVE